jgi:glycosyltransferase involved in cell wall biosynthesis
VWNFSPDDINVHETRTLGVPIYFFPSGVSRVVKLRGFRHLARLLDPEVIHSYSFYTNFAAYWAALGTKAVAMGSLREDFTHAQKRGGLWRGRLNARWPRYQIYNSLSSAEKARRATDIFSPKHIDIVRNGVDLQRFGGFEGSPVSRAYIVGIGSLQPLKRWDRLLRIVHQLKNKRADCWIRIAGDGPERMSLEKQAQDLGISQCVEFIGPTLDVPGLLEKSRFLVHTSDTEGCPNVVMEAMASGRAVVAMEAGDIRFLVEDGKTGFVVRCGDETAFAERVLQLLSDDELCRRMGLAARAKAEREFGLGLLVSETLNAYRAAGWKG